ECPILMALRFIYIKKNVNRILQGAPPSRISTARFNLTDHAFPQRQRLRGVSAACCSVFF
ncbi:MAG: hypothetical protein JSW26_21650, partial [Desulfobacterales bacterium]